MTVGIVGLGLIGGSLVKAFRACTDHTVLGFDADSAVEATPLWRALQGFPTWCTASSMHKPSAIASL